MGPPRSNDFLGAPLTTRAPPGHLAGRPAERPPDARTDDTRAARTSGQTSGRTPAGRPLTTRPNKSIPTRRYIPNVLIGCLHLTAQDKALSP